MDAWSFSLPAGFTCPLARYGERDICGSCYAKINRFMYRGVQGAQWVRYRWAEDAVGTGDFVPAMISALEQYVDNGYFRGHDSGDFFSPRYVDAWYDVCCTMSHIKFWFPTRNWHKEQKVWRAPLRRLAKLSNVVVRPSALSWNDRAPEVSWLSAGSTAATVEGYGADLGCKECPKSLGAGSCEKAGCRSCWEDSDLPISYLVHGVRGIHRVHRVSANIELVRKGVAKEYAR